MARQEGLFGRDVRVFFTRPVLLVHCQVPCSCTDELSGYLAQTTQTSEGNYLFTGVVSVTLNFHPQGRNVNDGTNEGKS